MVVDTIMPTKEKKKTNYLASELSKNFGFAVSMSFGNNALNSLSVF